MNFSHVRVGPIGTQRESKGHTSVFRLVASAIGTSHSHRIRIVITNGI